MRRCADARACSHTHGWAAAVAAAGGEISRVRSTYKFTARAGPGVADNQHIQRMHLLTGFEEKDVGRQLRACARASGG
eukprot:scaffold204274_cov18-Tisochrysis_lutea.AAC.1